MYLEFNDRDDLKGLKGLISVKVAHKYTKKEINKCMILTNSYLVSAIELIFEEMLL